MKIKKEYVLRDVGSTAMVVPLGKACRKFKGVIELNDTAKYIWNEIAAGRNENEIVEGLSKKYQINTEHSIRSVQSAIEQMRELSVIED